ncbi:uncharacterized protein Z518_00341 [Rhinocladiella mackenziei CBS 650.93]|uniref:Rhinocladiella mackenziei CBS 650.93 unplaced genomic scaffold supercont1.1, whole genome shotgun sequence n=1 Tax=Rhinocladiella mackenziei CBS 650.93 TaxID=1442369 RepID=A0A0D2G3S1_9EURO|nr:uncharacterized protein Z518_00341 [Rhinocladiella mackenziei CBS 650.93]KIX09262.1 hypothetical protein Z518_00341 [Rhinocladiella mackenziei CBS 650.93]
MHVLNQYGMAGDVNGLRRLSSQHSHRDQNSATNGLRISLSDNEELEASCTLLLQLVSLGAKSEKIWGNLLFAVVLSRHDLCQRRLGILARDLSLIGAFDDTLDSSLTVILPTLFQVPEWHHVFEFSPLSAATLRRDPGEVLQLVLSQPRSLRGLNELGQSLLRISLLGGCAAD